MKVLILGATGRTGRYVLDEAIAQGYNVHCLVRDKARVEQRSERIHLFEGTPLNADDIERAVDGCEAAISVLNVSRKSDFPWAALKSPKDLMSASIKNLTSVGKRYALRRLIVCSAAGVGETADNLPFWFKWIINTSNIKYSYEDHERQEEIVRASGMDWTIVRPTGLTNSEKPQDIIVSYSDGPKPNMTISRKAAAKFMVDALQDDSLIGKAPVISGK